MQDEANHSRDTAFDRAPHCPGGVLTRRAFLERMAGAATAAAGTGMGGASGAPEAEGPVGRVPTSIGLCKR